MWKMWATQARMKPCSASHTLSFLIDSPATRLTSGSLLGKAVAMPPMGTAPRRRQTATRRRKMSARNGVVLMSTPKRSGQTDLGSAMTNSKMLAFRSQRAAFKPAAYGPSAPSISSICQTAGSDSTRGMPRITAGLQEGQRLAARVEEVAVPRALRRALELGQIEVDALAAVGLGARPGSRA